MGTWMSRQIYRYEAMAKTIASARIKEWRDSHDLSQAKIAAEVGISERSFRHYAQGVRQLPQSVRLKLIDKFQFDPMPTTLIYQSLGLPMPDEPQPGWPFTLDRRNFWRTLRREARAFREKNYSKPAQMLLQCRDNIYALATLYYGCKHVSLVLDIPFGFGASGTDWMFVMSFIVILILIPSVIMELPLIKVTQHLLKR